VLRRIWPRAEAGSDVGGARVLRIHLRVQPIRQHHLSIPDESSVLAYLPRGFHKVQLIRQRVQLIRLRRQPRPNESWWVAL
jgi:hypothetical protein